MCSCGTRGFPAAARSGPAGAGPSGALPPLKNLSNSAAARVGSALALLAVLMALVRPAAAEVAVEIQGVDGELRQNVWHLLSIARLAAEEREVIPDRDAAEFAALELEEGVVTVGEVRRRHRVAPGQIREALMPFGFYQPRIEAELTETDAGFLARYVIDPGPPAVIRRLRVEVLGEGSDDSAVQRVLRDIRLAEGQRVDHRYYEEAKERLFDAAFDRGFLAAAWHTSEIRVLEDRLHADVSLVLDSGPLYRFGEVTFDHEVLDPEFLARFVHIEPGDRYNVRRLLALQRSLRDTEYFARVEVRADPRGADEAQRVPIRVVTEPAPSQRYTMGVGYGSDTGPRATFGVLLRRLNDQGHRLGADLRLSQIEASLGLRYDIPIRDVATDRLSFTATARREEVGDADVDQFAIGVSEVITWRGFRRHLYLQAQRELFEFDGIQEEGVNLVMPGVTLSRERADDVLYPTRGYRLWGDWRAGVDQLLSDVSFTRLELAASWVRGIADDTRLLVRAEAGWLWTDQFDQLPPSQRFFAGGDRSIRGYGYRKVGPVDPAGTVLGGERLLVGSIELERLFFNDYGAALFVDAGDAFVDSPDLKVGAGIGLRWRSPIGVVRLDVAHPFDDPQSNFRLHLTIGAEI